MIYIFDGIDHPSIQNLLIIYELGFFCTTMTFCMTVGWSLVSAVSPVD
jgi:hypothetical protein